jgi:hypothetical protein
VFYASMQVSAAIQNLFKAENVLGAFRGYVNEIGRRELLDQADDGYDAVHVFRPGPFTEVSVFCRSQAGTVGGRLRRRH